MQNILRLSGAAFVCAALLGCMTLTPQKAKAELQRILAGKIGGELNVVNAAMLVESGKKNFSWSGAAGTADPASGIPMTADTPFHTASVGKMFTAMSIARLVEQGRISFDDPISKYLPAGTMAGLHVFGGQDFSADITVRHLLAHTSGLPDFFFDKPTAGESFLEKAYAEPGRFWTPEETVAFAKTSLTPVFPPGGGFFYSDTNYALLGMIIERVTGRTLFEEFSSGVFAPLGMKSTYLTVGHDPRDKSMAHVLFFTRDVTGNIPLLSASWAGCGVVSTLEDLRKFMRGLVDGKVVSKETLTLMRSETKVFENTPGIEYGLGFMIFNFPKLAPGLAVFPPIWGHSGSTGAFLYYCPGLDAVLVGTMDQQATRESHVNMIIEAMGVLMRVR
jgi:D-alanyl-D-alanine carboxypeptidase